MHTKVVALLLFLAVAAHANPGFGSQKRWISRMPRVTPNPRAYPLPKFIDASKTHVHPRIPGTKAVPGCGVSNGASSKIVGGTEAVPHSYPWQVALYIDNIYFCGGFLISDEWVVSAGHCTTGAQSIRVVLGAHDLNVAEPSQVTMVSSDIITHENYGPILLANDIGLVHLPTPVTINSDITPVCLPSYSDANLAVGTIVNPSGWGKTSDAASGISNILNQVTNPIISQQDCFNVYGNVITDSIFCTDTTGAMGTCNGDSGGPVNYVVGGLTYSRGVVSFVASAGCQSGLPDGFTRVTSFLSWIETNTGIAIDP